MMMKMMMGGEGGGGNFDGSETAIDGRRWYYYLCYQQHILVASMTGRTAGKIFPCVIWQSLNMATHSKQYLP